MIKSFSSYPLRLFLSILFLVAIALFILLSTSNLDSHSLTFLIIASVVGGYMALNIGANDLANNVGPAVGSGALTLLGALIIAAIFEASGALIAGGDVIGTVRNGIIATQFSDSSEFIALMLAALIGGAIWLNVATAVGAPVSTTHSIVGGILGAGIAAGGWGVAHWDKMSLIAASWVISPMMGGAIAALLLYLIKRIVTDSNNVMRSARLFVPLLISFMAWLFSTYLILKGFKKLWEASFFTATLVGFCFAVIVYIIIRPIINRRVEEMSKRKKSGGRRLGRKKVNRLFTIPLICAAALLSFAHGSNDVANAIGPLAAIVATLKQGAIASQVVIPLWVMLIGALGLSIGLMLFGPKLIRTVGSEITELDKIRAFCIMIAASLTVIIASQFGLPVSSTHIAVGAIFGVGFLREFLDRYYHRAVAEIKENHVGDPKALKRFLLEFREASYDIRKNMLKDSRQKKEDSQPLLSLSEQKTLKKVVKKQLVQRNLLWRIVAAWLITVPVSGIIAAMAYFMIRGIQGQFM